MSIHFTSENNNSYCSNTPTYPVMSSSLSRWTQFPFQFLYRLPFCAWPTSLLENDQITRLIAFWWFGHIHETLRVWDKQIVCDCVGVMVLVTGQVSGGKRSLQPTYSRRWTAASQYHPVPSCTFLPLTCGLVENEMMRHVDQNPVDILLILEPEIHNFRVSLDISNNLHGVMLVYWFPLVSQFSKRQDEPLQQQVKWPRVASLCEW